MTTEEPDGPMPMVFSPETYRAEVARRKAAESNRDEVVEQLEGAMAEARDLRANVATLVEQLGEAERRAEGNFADGIDARLRLAEVTRERDEARHNRNSLLDALDANSMADGLARARGAAQPVVELRDETRMCCGEPMHFACLVCDNIGIQRAGYAHHPSGTAPSNLPDVRAALDELTDFCRRKSSPPGFVDSSIAVAIGCLRDALRHPSGTEGPQGGDAVDLAEVWAVCNERYGDIGMDAYSPAEAMRMVLDRAEEVGEERALAASPPDGTAPERALRARIESLAQRMQEESEGDGAPTNAFDRGQELSCRYVAVLLRKILAGEDIGYEPATLPPDGMPGEPAAKCYCGKPATRWCGSMNDPRKAMRCDECARSWMRSEPLAAAPPTVPGEPASRFAGEPPFDQHPNRAAPPTVPGEPPRSVRGLVDEMRRVDGYTAGIAVNDAKSSDGLRIARAAALLEGVARDSELFAAVCFRHAEHEASCGPASPAPPTPPLTPERAPAEEWETVDFAGRIATVVQRMSGAPHSVIARAVANLLNGRAPLDEAAVRADERRRTELDIAAWLRQLKPDPHEADDAWDEGWNLCCEHRAIDIDASDYPRRSEGAG